jgi:Fe-S oxidoreductase
MEAKYEFARKYRDDILRCSRCGYCQAVCPAFGTTLRPSLNARGKMLLLKEVMDGDLELTDDLIETLFQCTTCAACTENCPSGVDVPAILKQARKDMVHIGSCHPAFTGMNDVLLKHTNIYAEEELPEFDVERGGTAENAFFVGCVGTYREDENTEAAIELLERLDVDFTMVEEVCCSGVLEDVGFKINPELARINIDRLKATGAKRIVTGCPNCYKTFKFKPEYKELQDTFEIVHLSQFLSTFDFPVKADEKITYHDSCDLGRHCNIFDEPRKTITSITDDFVEMESHHSKSLCCGSGGGMRGAFAKNSVEMAKRRLAQALDTGADILLTDCNSCVHNLSNAKKRADKIEIRNTVEYLNELMDEAE